MYKHTRMDVHSDISSTASLHPSMHANSRPAPDSRNHEDPLPGSVRFDFYLHLGCLCFFACSANWGPSINLLVCRQPCDQANYAAPCISTWKPTPTK
ncbi:unnamed protein product [Protopolystoma xenopodis]|uniref:Uncharacterized protein n=1 Tax=Protopolystoma xenopodis TaxID=117903 RepID=A0A448XCA3_9PLAT|nr:unnamed protein product [Protopolystoma xenopodis]